MADLAGAGDAPRVCYLGQATGDQPTGFTVFYGAFAGTRFRASHLALYPMPNVEDIRAHLLAQDVIWVGGGSVANLLRGLAGARPRRDPARVLGGQAWCSAVSPPARSAGTPAAPPTATARRCGPSPTGWAGCPYGNGVHYDSEEQRRPLMHRLVADGTLPASHCTDDGVGLVYRGTELAEAVADRPGVAAYELVRAEDGTARETRIEPRLLSAAQ